MLVFGILEVGHFFFLSNWHIDSIIRIESDIHSTALEIWKYMEIDYFLQKFNTLQTRAKMIKTFKPQCCFSLSSQHLIPWKFPPGQSACFPVKEEEDKKVRDNSM